MLAKSPEWYFGREYHAGDESWQRILKRLHVYLFKVKSPGGGINCLNTITQIIQHCIMNVALFHLKTLSVVHLTNKQILVFPLYILHVVFLLT